VLDAELEAAFPNLAQSGYRVTSPATRRYNCIAWAAHDEMNWWWPVPGAYWPPQVLQTETVEAFIEAYQTLGYELCDSDQWEDGFEKIAIYADAEGNPTHAARQLPSGQWTSKIGRGIDIEHDTLDGLSGILYGTPIRFLKRPLQAA